MSTTTINWLNFGLVFLSLAIAFIFPFELFILAYAFLGPLHYLTELPWLHKKDYFVASPKHCWFLWGLALIVTAIHIRFDNTYAFAGGNFLAVGTALAFVLASTKLKRSLLVLFMAFMILPVLCFAPSVVLFGTFLTSLVHVCIFTLLFMISGVLKERTLSGMATVIAYILVALFLLLFAQPAGTYETSYYYALNAFELGRLHEQLAIVLGWALSWDMAVAAMRFVAFAYIYHYFNWFSKTSIIKWHEVDKKVASIILVVYLVSVSAYLYDYALGLKVLLFLSLAHVYLELPLNWQSLKIIGKEAHSLAFNR